MGTVLVCLKLRRGGSYTKVVRHLNSGLFNMILYHPSIQSFNWRYSRPGGIQQFLSGQAIHTRTAIYTILCSCNQQYHFDIYQIVAFKFFALLISCMSKWHWGILCKKDSEMWSIVSVHAELPSLWKCCSMSGPVGRSGSYLAGLLKFYCVLTNNKLQQFSYVCACIGEIL
jgi:hypothetical protein